MQYVFLRDGVPETVEREPWGWEAYYKDGTVLKQFDDNGIFHQIKEIKQPEMVVFKMVEYLGNGVFSILWHPSRSLICFYQNTVLNDGQIHYRVPCFGYSTNVNGVTHKVILMLTPTGEVVVTEDTNKVEIN